jgi:hypothetical protein
MPRTSFLPVRVRPLFSCQRRCPWPASGARQGPVCKASENISLQNTNLTASAVEERGQLGDHGAPPGNLGPGASGISGSSSGDGGMERSSSHQGNMHQTTEELVDWFCEQYAISDRRRVRAPLRRALAALKAEDPQRTQLSLELDILPKLEVRAWAHTGGSRGWGLGCTWGRQQQQAGTAPVCSLLRGAGSAQQGTE